MFRNYVNSVFEKMREELKLHLTLTKEIDALEEKLYATCKAQQLEQVRQRAM
jgi:hypothetical protein